MIALAGCGTKYAQPPQTQSPPAQVPTTLPEEPVLLPTLPPATPPEVIRPTTIITTPNEAARSLPAAIALRDQASRAAAADNHSRAIGLLERAIRISPQDPLTFEALAESHLALDQPGTALQLARRALSLNPTAAQRESLTLLAEKSQALQ